MIPRVFCLIKDSNVADGYLLSAFSAKNLAIVVIDCLLPKLLTCRRDKVWQFGNLATLIMLRVRHLKVFFPFKDDL